MNKKAFYFFLILITSSYKLTEKEVFICGPKGAKKYHYYQDCRGLSQCDHKIFKVTVSVAENYNLTLCRWED